MNSAPALSADGATLYIAVSNAQQRGYLLALDSGTLAPTGRVSLLDPKSNAQARITGDATSSPVIGPDGDVYFGVLEAIEAATGPVSVWVGEEAGCLLFEVWGELGEGPALVIIGDMTDTIGGTLTVEPAEAGGLHLRASLPID